MKAVKVVDKKLIITKTNKPVPRDNEILIKVKAAGLNRADIAQKMVSTLLHRSKSEVLGLECSGVVERVGKEVKSKKPGDEVMALLGGGGYAEYVSCHEFHAINKPKFKLD